MTIYKYEIVETLSRIVEIEADTESDAYHELRRRYQDEEIVLDAGDYVDTEFNEWVESKSD